MKKTKKLLSVLLAVIIALSTLAAATINVGAAEVFDESVGATKVYSYTISVGEYVYRDFTLSSYEDFYMVPQININNPNVIRYSQQGSVIYFIGIAQGYCEISIQAAIYNNEDQSMTLIDELYKITVKSNSTPAATKPGATSFSSVTYNGSDINLKWNEASNASKYQIARLKTGESKYEKFELTNTSVRDSNVTAGVKYTYQVRAMNGNTAGAWSKSVTVVTMTKPNVTVSNKSNGIRAEWTPVRGATKYKVYYKSEYDSGWSSVTTSNTYYPLLNTVIGRKYAFQIQPIGSSNIAGPYSSVKNIVFKIPGMSVKPSVTLSNKSNGIRVEWVEWNAVSGASSYVVYYCKSGASSWSSVTTKNTYYPYLNVTAGSRYSFQVLPMFGSTKGTYSDVKSLTFTVPGMSVKPKVTLSNKSNGIRVEWNSVSGASSYVVYYCKSGATSWSSVTTTNNYYPFLSAVGGTRYNFQVLPMFGSAKGTYSDVVGIKYTHATNEKPEVSVDNKKNGIRVEWNKVSGATSYIVYYKQTSSSTWSSTTTANTYYPYFNTIIGTRYDFQVQPLFNGEKGAYSSKWSITFFPETDTSISTPTVSLTIDYGIDVNWSSVSGASGYVVQYMNYDTDVRQYVYTSGTGTYRWLKPSELQSGHYYYVWVRAYKQINGSKYYGPWSSGVRIYYK